MALQGNELKVLRKRAPYKRIIYCGDGANDLCPVLRLGSQDIVLARRGYDLDTLIQKQSSANECVKADVYCWDTHQQLLHLIQKLV